MSRGQKHVKVQPQVIKANILSKNYQCSFVLPCRIKCDRIAERQINTQV